MKLSSSIVPVVVLLLVATLLGGLLAAPPRFMLDVGRGGASSLTTMGITDDSLYLHHFFAAETSNDGTTFRWSSPQSRLTVPGLLNGGVLSLRLHGTATPRSGDSRLWLHQYYQYHHFPYSKQRNQDDHALATFHVAATPGWRVYQVLIPPSSTPSWYPYGVSIGIATVPFCPPTYDSRVLGVPIDTLQLTPLATHAYQVALRPLMVQTILIMCGLALCVVGILSIVARFGQAAQGEHKRLSVWTWAWASIAAVAWLWWAWRSPYTLAWLCSPPIVGGAAVLGGSIVVGRRVWRWLYSPTPTPTAVLAQRYALPMGVILLWGIAHSVLFAPPTVSLSLRGGAALLLLGLPGGLLGWQWFATDQQQGILARWFLALCSGVAVPLVLLLALHALPGALPAWVVLVGCNVLLVIALIWWMKAVFTAPTTVSYTPAPYSQRTRGKPKHPLPLLGGEGTGD